MLENVKWTYQAYEDVSHKTLEEIPSMVNPQESLDQGISTQYLELSDLSTDDSNVAKVTERNGDKAVKVEPRWYWIHFGVL